MLQQTCLVHKKEEEEEGRSVKKPTKQAQSTTGSSSRGAINSSSSMFNMIFLSKTYQNTTQTQHTLEHSSK
jgi:hypothetical protein